MATRKELDRQRALERLLQVFDANYELIELFGKQVLGACGTTELQRHIHSMKWRVKDRDHLRDKLLRKMKKAEAAGESFDITPQNILLKVNDLVGVRLLHLYTRQVKDINEVLCRTFQKQNFGLIEGPEARSWDDESRAYFEKECGIKTIASPTMYTSVHYVFSSASATQLTCEVQLRTLLEEVWGEVDHKLNYPVPTTVLSSREQLKVLAKVTSSASRLVDSIFLTHEAAMAPVGGESEKGHVETGGNKLRPRVAGTGEVERRRRKSRR